VLQNSAIRAIFKPNALTNLSKLAMNYGIISVNERMLYLSNKYMNKCLINRNVLITALIEEYLRGFGNNREETKESALFLKNYRKIESSDCLTTIQ
jgi:hypothetical protein